MLQLATSICRYYCSWVLVLEFDTIVLQFASNVAVGYYSICSLLVLQFIIGTIAVGY